MIESFRSPGNIIHSAKGVERKDDKVCGSIEDEREGAFYGIADYFESLEAEGVDQNWENVAEKDEQY